MLTKSLSYQQMLLVLCAVSAPLATACINPTVVGGDTTAGGGHTSATSSSTGQDHTVSTTDTSTANTSTTATSTTSTVTPGTGGGGPSIDSLAIRADQIPPQTGGDTGSTTATGGGPGLDPATLYL